MSRAHRFRSLLVIALALAPCTAFAATAPRWEFRVRPAASMDALTLLACSDVAQPEVCFVAGTDAAVAHVREATRDSGAGIARDTVPWRARGWRKGECLQVRMDLAGIVAAERTNAAARANDYALFDPRRWLWRPWTLDPDSTIRFDLPADWSVSAPWAPVSADDALSFRIGSADPDWPARVAIGRFAQVRIERPGGALRVAVMKPWSAQDATRLEPVADALVQAYGRLPRRDTQVLVAPLPGMREPMPWGEVMRGGASAVHLYPGAAATRDALHEDWTATHEFSHLLHPHLGTRGRWLSEGLASYYQNVLRARSGALDADTAWERIEAGFERGRRETRSQGLALADASRRMGPLRAFMRTYWSGAAYWLESDLALRAHGSSLDAALARYAACCLTRITSSTPQAFVTELERIAPAAALSARLARYEALMDFPEVNIPAPGDPLREAIMQRRDVAKD